MTNPVTGIDGALAGVTPMARVSAASPVQAGRSANPVEADHAEVSALSSALAKLQNLQSTDPATFSTTMRRVQRALEQAVQSSADPFQKAILDNMLRRIATAADKQDLAVLVLPHGPRGAAAMLHANPMAAGPPVKVEPAPDAPPVPNRAIESAAAAYERHARAPDPAVLERAMNLLGSIVDGAIPTPGSGTGG